MIKEQSDLKPTVCKHNTTAKTALIFITVLILKRHYICQGSSLQ